MVNARDILVKQGRWGRVLVWLCNKHVHNETWMFCCFLVLSIGVFVTFLAIFSDVIVWWDGMVILCVGIVLVVLTPLLSRMRDKIVSMCLKRWDKVARVMNVLERASGGNS